MRKHQLSWDEAVVALAHTQVFSPKQQKGSWPSTMTSKQLAVLQWPYASGEAYGRALAEKRSRRIMDACQDGTLLHVPLDANSSSQVPHITSNAFGSWLVSMELEPSSRIAAWLASQPLTVNVKTSSLIANNTNANAQILEAGQDASIDLSVLATRSELINAFGLPTGMDRTWFKNLKDAPELKRALKRPGKPGRRPIEPIFCPFRVLQWLTGDSRRKGRPLAHEKGWRLFELHFPAAYSLHDSWDPRAKDQ